MADLTHVHTSCLQVCRFFTPLFRGAEETPESVTDLLTLHVVALSGRVREALMRVTSRDIPEV